MTESPTRLGDEVAASDAARRKLAPLVAQEMSGTKRLDWLEGQLKARVMFLTSRLVGEAWP